MAKRRQFGKIRKLPSGRYQASYIDQRNGRRVTAESTFAAKADANAWLASVQTDLARGDRIDESSGRIPLEEYGGDWLANKADLRPRTRELYAYLLRLHIMPTLGDHRVAGIRPQDIRSWHRERLESGLSPTTVAKAYRLLRQILEASVDDGLRRDNPCKVKGAATERSAERRIPSLDDVALLVESADPWLRPMILLAAYGGLRRGECLGLTRHHVNLDGELPTVTVDQAWVFLQSGESILQEPKTKAGFRSLALPAGLADPLRHHLATYVGPEPEAFLFAEQDGLEPVGKARFRSAWDRAKRNAGISCTFHDLRHVAGTLNAIAGATTKEAMARLGHASPDAALRYQHALAERDTVIAQAIGELIPTRQDL